jgi:hypothetical protein
VFILSNVGRYVNPNAFVTWQIFNDYLPSVFSPNIAHWRQSIADVARAFLICHGHRDSKSQQRDSRELELCGCCEAVDIMSAANFVRVTQHSRIFGRTN